MRGTVTVHRAVVSLLCLCTLPFTSPPSFSTESEATAPQIRIVRESKERIEVDRPRVTELPKTLSIDALTSAEVLDIQRSVYLISLYFGPDVTDR